jgi:hypothetical protein
MQKFLKDNGLSLVLFFLFVASLGIGQLATGHHESNKDRGRHGKPPETLGEYIQSAHFLEATSENWESEFLQMGVYVFLTVYLFQRGSSESKDPDSAEGVDRDPRLSPDKSKAPWPVRHGGWVLKLYEHSLTIVFVLLFLGCFIVHGLSGCANYNEELVEHGEPLLGTLEYMGTSRFWFESFQNWQSEFLAILSMVCLSIYLRQRGSPESKPVDAPHDETGA